MGRRLSYILLTILLLTVFSTQTTSAIQQPTEDSFFSFFENYIIAYTAKNLSDKQVLAAQTKTPVISVTLPPIPPAPTEVSAQPAPQLSDVSSYILNGVNQYRSSLGLSPVQASAETCAFAATRAEEISHSFNHDGFYTRVANRTLPYTQWAHATENIAEAPNYQEVVTLWKNSPEHAENMRDNTPFVCIMQYGAYYAFEGMRP